MNLPKKYILGLTLIVLLCCSPTVFGQLTGSKYIPGNYATITAAVTALNTSGVGAGGVTFNVAAGYTETISSAISLTATGTAANPIIFQKDPATSGANPIITAYTGGVGTPATATQDGIWRLVGSDYVTINGIDLRDNPSNTTNPSTMEYGYALYKASTSNGCQYDTIKNCTITLNRINNATGTAPMVDGSAGIIVMNALYTTATTVVTPIAGGTNSNNTFYSNTIQNCNTGIALIGYAAASPFTLADVNNDVGGSSLSTGNTIINYGGAAAAANAAAGIRTLAQYSINISYNTINNNNGSGTNHPTIVRGIYNNTALSANATITNNTITVNGTGTTQIITAIENAAGSTAAGNTINISNNTITNCTYTTATSGGLYGIYNTATPATLTINSNTFSGNATSATTGLHYAIFNAGAVTTAININSNNIGTGLTNAITFNAANSGAQLFINNTAGAATTALSIANNNFQGINYATAGTGANTYISNTAATLSQAINSNTFTNLNVNTTGSITFIANSVIVSATGTQNVNSNSISGTFTKAGAGGTVTLFNSVASSISGSVINNNNNDFSNITVTGATIIAGWVNTDAGASTKSIQNNNFSNWTGATGTITGISVNITGTNNATSGNTINNFSSAAAITGIATAAGNDNIYSNTINTLSTTGAVAVIGIAVTAGTTKNIYRNKIYDLQANNATGTVNGITISGTTGAVTTANIYNNIIGDLRTPAASAADPVRGIAVTSTKANSNINVYYNTIYLNASSTGTNFGTTGIYHTASATATTATLDLRNNIIVNTSTPNGTGIIVAYRRSSANLGNYATTSNNNLFFSGVPGTTRLLFYDGTNSDQLLTTFKTRVSTRETLSVTEDLISGSRFLSTSGASASFLHLDPTKATLAESGAANISGFTDDADAQTRQGNAGYAGTGTAPDIGADEFDGTAGTGLAGSYNVGAGQAYTSLTGAGGLFAALNTFGLSDNVTINITSDLAEDGSYTLYQWTEQGVGNYALTINPDATTTRTISGDVVAGLIRFNGADRVNIDGSTGRYLTFRNTNTAGTTGTAFTFINGASNNTIQNCTIEAYANATNGVILFSTSTVAGGNSNNQISNCNINATISSNTGNLCIYSAGTVGNENSTNTISNNTIYNYRDKGIDITATGSTAWTISGNSFYNGDVTSAINYAASSTLYGIRILGGSGYAILNNYIGGNAPLATGTAEYTASSGGITYQGIIVTTASATPVSDIKGNTIAGITINSATGGAISGIAIIGGTLKNIGGNKIYNLRSGSATGTVSGIFTSGAITNTLNIYNNLIGDLHAPAANSATDLVRGINLTTTAANSTTNVYYNTIYLNTSSTGTNFSSTGIYHTGSATATTAALNLRNNSISNISTPKGTGLTVAYRRSSTALNNYVTTSNNNLFYAGIPAANSLIFYNGTNSDQTLAAFKTRVSTRETQSVTEDLSTKFLSTSGTSASFLHMNTTIASLVEDNAVNISGFTDDVDGDTRQGNSGYAGYGTSPDIGADEFNGVTDNNKTWTGTSSNDWNTATNWASNSIPAAANNAIIPGSLATYPLLSTGTYTIQNVTLQSGGTLTINGATLQIGGAINNSGTFTVSNGTIEMNGTSAQTIPSGAFASSTLPNLTITNSADVTVSGTLNISGTLKANSGTLNTGGFVTLLSTATQTAQIDGSGAGQVLGNVMMQRYLASGFGYKYLSSPFQAATVNELADDINLTASFPALYKYDESLASSGYVGYTNTSGLLVPLQGYAANFGSSATPKTVTISGVVNNGNLSLGTLYNHNNEFTQGFNLVGNPYPSPIDWNAGSGWTRTNIDNALYYFNAGSTDQYTGTYSSYINGVSSNGIASNVIPSMQGFFIHVSNGAYPVSASLAINNNARVKNLTVVFQAASTFQQPPPLLRIDAGFADNKTPSDPLVVYFNDAATPAFDKNYDALKLMNTNAGVPNFYSIASDASKLSVAALRYQGNNVTSIPLGLSIKQSGWISFNVRDLENMPDSLHIYLTDAVTGSRQDLRLTTSYRVYLQPGKYESRFSIVFSAKELVNNQEEQSLFNAYSSQGKLYATTNIDKGTLLVSNIMGQVIYRQAISSKGVHELNAPSLTGIYIISLIANNNIQSKKIFISN